jgi:hypothetical protein
VMLVRLHAKTPSPVSLTSFIVTLAGGFANMPGLFVSSP